MIEIDIATWGIPPGCATLESGLSNAKAEKTLRQHGGTNAVGDRAARQQSIPIMRRLAL
jgi:hypothetical protein